MKTMTKLLNLVRVSVETNIAKLCYVVAKMTINFNSQIVISVQTNTTKSRYVGAKTMTKLLNLVGVSVKTNIAKLCYVAAKVTSNFNYKTFAVVETR